MRRLRLQPHDDQETSSRSKAHDLWIRRPSHEAIEASPIAHGSRGTMVIEMRPIAAFLSYHTMARGGEESAEFISCSSTGNRPDPAVRR